MRVLILFFVFLTFSSQSFSAVIFQDNFDSCTSNCLNGDAAPNSSNWTQWYRTEPYYAIKDGITQYAGEMTSSGRGGSGKSLKLWRHTDFNRVYNGSLVYTPPSTYSDFYMRFYAKMPTGMDLFNSNYLKLFRFDTSTADLYININMESYQPLRQVGMLQVHHNDGWRTILTHAQLAPLLDGNWHAWQFRFNLAGDSLTLWIDGGEPITISNVGFSGTWNSYLIHFPLGNAAPEAIWQSSWQAFEVDDLVIATTKAETDPSPFPVPYSEASSPVGLQIFKK